MTDFEHVDFENAGYRIVMTPEKWESIQRELDSLREEIATLMRQAAEDDMVIDRILTRAFNLPCGPDGCYVDPDGDSEFGRKGAADVAQIVAEREAKVHADIAELRRWLEGQIEVRSEGSIMLSVLRYVRQKMNSLETFREVG